MRPGSWKVWPFSKIQKFSLAGIQVKAFIRFLKRFRLDTDSEEVTRQEYWSGCLSLL